MQLENQGKKEKKQMSTKIRISRALLSVSDKTGLIEFARGLVKFNVELLSTGGTAKALREAGLPVIDVSEYTGSPELFNGRIKTLHLRVHGGILYRRDSDEHVEQAGKNNIPPIDLVVVNLYPFEETVAKPDVTNEDAIENIDIGGPAMLRSAAKNHASITVVVEPSDYAEVLREMGENGGGTTLWLRERLANKVFARTSRYDGAIAAHLTDGQFKIITGDKVCEFKGENGPQTPAVLFTTGSDDPLALDKFDLIEGSAPSYNNWCDVDRLLQTMTHIAATWKLNFGEVPLIAIGGKHGNACGAAVEDSFPEFVVSQMISGDGRAIFGGLIMTNFVITDSVAVAMVTAMPNEKALFDGIIAPNVFESAARALARNKGKCRIMTNPCLGQKLSGRVDKAPRFRYVRGGFLTQPNYDYLLDLNDKDIKVYGELDADTAKDLLLAYCICSTSNSNTITLVRERMLIGNGVGQQDRVGAAELAIKRAVDAGHGYKKCWKDWFRAHPRALEGSVACSDSFFPFPDGVQVLISAGVKAIFSTSGSIKDQEIRDLCEKNGVTLVQLPDSKARGFFGH
jgi:phosphoribosylaminoimidazolecarboxamide formyltransferase/IMP cyclohydrolase